MREQIFTAEDIIDVYTRAQAIEDGVLVDVSTVAGVFSIFVRGHNELLNPIAEPAKTEYRYRIINTGESSRRYGNCEVCHQPVSEVYTQVEERKYKYGWTLADCKDFFGHRDCLEKQRRGNFTVQYG